MIRRAGYVVLGFLAVLLAAPQSQGQTITAEELRETGALDAAAALTLRRPDLFRNVDGSVLIHGLPVLTLLDGRRFLAGELARMGRAPLDLFPVAFLSAAQVQPVAASPMYGADSPGGVVNLRLKRNYEFGEVGVFYGRSGGKFHLEDKQAYFIGGVGNERFQITAGAAFQESSGRILYHGSSTPPH